ncbi:pneumococcal-type histidine triad protein, partial [Streptococcus suis]
IAYIDDSKGKVKAPKTNKTMDQISAEEGISAEQIVVKITDQGYVTSHGDHYHFYNGKVPYDAIISEELLMTDPNY